MMVAALLTAVGLWGVTKATAPPTTVGPGPDGHPTVAEEPAGSTSVAAAIEAQQAREMGFIGRAMNRKGNSIYSWNQTVLDPGQVSITKHNDYRTTIAGDHSAFTYNNLRNVFDGDYHRPSFPRTGTYMPLIGIPHAGFEIKSGQNINGDIALFGSNPYAMPENGSADSKIQNNQGWVLAKTYGTSQIPFDANSEVAMSFAGLRNPWRTGGLQQQLHSSYLPPDKDQLTGSVPLAHPQKIFDVGNRPTQVTAPPHLIKTARVFNRNVRNGR